MIARMFGVAARFGVAVLVGVVEGAFWLAYAIRQTSTVASDFLRARESMRNGILRCPVGHEIETTAESCFYTCAACGWTWSDAPIWACPNPECGAVTPYLNCACGRSIRNPYRWGRP